ncbi:MAG: TolC family protein [Acidobacteria bacterium]|nr:MAG: TolC family protein [Acidobacteriota bacterium]
MKALPVATVLLALATVVPLALAEGQPPEAPSPVHLTLEQAVEAALSASPGLEALEHASEAARQSARAASRSRWGQLDALATTERFDADRITLPISSELLANGFGGLPFDRNQVHYGLSFRVPLYVGGRLRSEREIARLEARQAASRLSGNRWQTRFNAVSLYGATAALDAAIEAARNEHAALETTRERVSLELESGRRARIDLLKIDDTLAQVEARIAELEGRRARSAALLLALCGRDPGLPLAVEPLEESALSHGMPDGKSLRAALTDNSSVDAARAEAEASRRRERIARSAFLPRLEAGGLYLANDAPSMVDDIATWELRLDLRVPLFAGGSRFSRVAAARAARNAAESRLERTWLTVSAELESALAEYRSARSSLEAAGRRLAAASEAARIEQLRYDVGSGRIEDLLQARAREAEAQAANAAARSAVVSARARIESVVEREIQP